MENTKQIVGYIENALSEGHFLRTLNEKGGTAIDFNNAYSDRYGGCCVLGAIMHGAGIASRDLEDGYSIMHLIYRHTGLTTLVLKQVEAGFEGWDSFDNNSGYYELGQHIRNTYR